MIAEHILKQIQERLDIVQWVGRYVTLKRRGQNFLGLCPFHLGKVSVAVYQSRLPALDKWIERLQSPS